jgi:type I restriction enzyme M protein
LAPGGRAAIVVPEGLLFGSTAGHVELRRKLLEDFEFLAVVSLPAGVFKPYAGVKTAIIVFRRPASEKAKHTDPKVWFYEVKNDGYDPERIVGGGRLTTASKNDLPRLIKQWDEFKSTAFKEPPGIEGGRLLPPGEAEPTCWWVRASAVAENGFNLTARSYKPHVSDLESSENPAELLLNTLDSERAIVSGIEKLLAQIKTDQ